jgi:quinolinate synthase
MEKAMPKKKYIPAPPEENSCSCNNCPHMKRNTMEKLYLCMKNLSPRIEMEESLRMRALKPIDRMLEMS